MFMQDRQRMIESVIIMGAHQCGYFWHEGRDPHEWIKSLCDCKYGASNFTKRDRLGEGTGCPELRSVHKILTTLTDEEWDELVIRAGGIQSKNLFSVGQTDTDED